MIYIEYMNLSGIDLNLLVVLDAVLRERNVTRAALRVGLSQSAMSHALRRLRILLDDPVVVRTPGGMHPTSRGRSLMAPVRSILDQVEASLAPPAAFVPADTTETFTLSLPDAGQVGILPLLSKRLKRDAPNAGIRIHPEPVAGYEALLADGTIDLALSVTSGATTGFNSEVVFASRFVSIVRTGHSELGKRLTLRRFARLEHIVLSGPGSVDPEIDQRLADHGLGRRVALAVPSLLAIPWLVAESDFVSTLPELLLALAPTAFAIERYAPPIPLEGVTGSLVWHERTQHDPAQQWLRDVVREICGRMDRAGHRGVGIGQG